MTHGLLHSGPLRQRLTSPAILCITSPGAVWRIAGFGIFLAGLMIGLRHEELAIGLALACFITLTPLLVLAALLYEFQTDSARVLPGFKALLILMLLSCAALEIFALGSLAFAWSSSARLVLLMMMAGAIALAIFSQAFTTRQPAPPVE